MNIKCSWKLLFAMIKRIIKCERIVIMPCLKCGHSNLVVYNIKLRNINNILRSFTLKCNECCFTWDVKETWEEVEDEKST